MTRVGEAADRVRRYLRDAAILTLVAASTLLIACTADREAPSAGLTSQLQDTTPTIADFSLRPDTIRLAAASTFIRGIFKDSLGREVVVLYGLRAADTTVVSQIVRVVPSIDFARVVPKRTGDVELVGTAVGKEYRATLHVR